MSSSEIHTASTGSSKCQHSARIHGSAGLHLRGVPRRRRKNPRHLHAAHADPPHSHHPVGQTRGLRYLEPAPACLRIRSDGPRLDPPDGGSVSGGRTRALLRAHRDVADPDDPRLEPASGRARGAATACARWAAPSLGSSFASPTTRGTPCPPGPRGRSWYAVPTYPAATSTGRRRRRRPFATGGLLTGDVGRLDQEGYLYLLDRKKDIIITGGENVWSAEVEAALYAHPDVIEAAVIGVPDETWGEAVLAVIVPAPGSSLVSDVGPHELIAHCPAAHRRLQGAAPIPFHRGLAEERDGEDPEVRSPPPLPGGIAAEGRRSGTATCRRCIRETEPATRIGTAGASRCWHPSTES